VIVFYAIFNILLGFRLINFGFKNYAAEKLILYLI